MFRLPPMIAQPAYLALLHGAGVLVAAALVVRGLADTLRGRDPIASLAAGMVAREPAVQTQPWYLLWALAPACGDRSAPDSQALLGWGCVVLATLMPATGGDFLHRGYELINAIAAAALLLLAGPGMDRFREKRAAGAPTAARERIADRRR